MIFFKSRAHELAHLNVPWFFDEPLDEDLPVAESLDGLRPGTFELVDDVFEPGDDPHASAASAIGSLQHDGHPVLRAEVVSVLGIGQRSVRAGDDGEAGVDGGLAGRHLVTHFGHHCGRWTDEPENKSI